jgi:hypothetical protein
VGEEVGDGVHMSQYVVKYEVEVLEEFHPPGLSASNFLGLAKVLEVFVVCSDMDGVVGAKEIGATAFKSVYNGGHFFIVDVVVSFGW